VSLTATRWAWDQRIAGQVKLVLLALADRANQKHGQEWQCWPSQQELAESCGISTRHIRRHLAELQRLGLVKATHRPGNGAGRTSTLYTLVPHQTSLDLEPLEPVDNQCTTQEQAVDKQEATGHRCPIALGGQPDKTGGATGHGCPVASLDNENEPRREKGNAIPDTATGAIALPIGLSLCDFDCQETGKALRPDLDKEAIADAWAKFAAYHQEETQTTNQWLASWRLWITREQKRHTRQMAATPTNGARAIFSAAHRLANPQAPAARTQETTHVAMESLSSIAARLGPHRK